MEQNASDKGQETRDESRREFLIGAVKGTGIAAVGGLVWAGFLERGIAYPTVLRPPGAVEEKRFLAACTKCGLCVAACPYKALVLSRPGDGRPIGTPYFVMRDSPCRMCRDIPCAVACPTGALDRGRVSDIDERGGAALNINKAQIGLAVIDRESCIAYWGIQCDACYRDCPLMDRAITVEYTRNDRTGKHAILGPLVHGDHCTGCGMCERACVTKKASIFVLPRSIAMGEPSSHYVRGWEERDEPDIKEPQEETRTLTPRSRKSPADYLNQGDL